MKEIIIVQKYDRLRNCQMSRPIENVHVQSTPLNLNRKYAEILFELRNGSNFQVLESCSTVAGCSPYLCLH